MLALTAYPGPAQATASGESDRIARQPDSTLQETMEAEAALSDSERSDCMVEQAICQSDCEPGATDRECSSNSCSSRLMACPAILTGPSPSLPLACRSADRDAFRRLEKQGELLDADPTLFAESYQTLVRARIACTAGNHAKALDLYDEIVESMAEKPVPGQAESKIGH